MILDQIKPPGIYNNPLYKILFKLQTAATNFLRDCHFCVYWEINMYICIVIEFESWFWKCPVV